MRSYLLTIATSYLLGSIPFGYILVRTFLRRDIRESGSGNIGATNVARSSPGLGAATLFLDALKGTGAVVLAMYVTNAQSASSEAANAGSAHAIFFQPHFVSGLAALFAVVGHIFPIWLKFQGGKGVATAVGGFVLLAPRAILACLVVFLLVVLTARFVSLGSIMAAGSFPVLTWYFYRGELAPRVLATVTLAALLVISRHYRNIERLLKGEEPRFHLRRQR